MLNKGANESPETQSNDPTYAKDIVLLTNYYAVFKKDNMLDSLRVYAPLSEDVRKPGSPFVMSVDLSYLKISILNYISSNIYGAILIENRSTANTLTLIQFRTDYSYEIRHFNNTYSLSLQSAAAFTSTSNDGTEYYIALSNPAPGSSFVAYKFSVNKMYPVVNLLKPVKDSGSGSDSNVISGQVSVGDKNISISATKIIGPDEETFSKTSQIEVVTTQDIYTVDLTQHLQLNGNVFYVDKTINYTDP
jgi:hypothetical protein